MNDTPTENIWFNHRVELVSRSQQNVVFRPVGDRMVYQCPLEVWMINPLPRNLKPVDA